MTYTNRNKIDLIIYLSKLSKEKIGEILNDNYNLIEDIAKSPALDLCPKCAEAIVDMDNFYVSTIAERPDLEEICSPRCIKKIAKREPTIIARRPDLNEICDNQCIDYLIKDSMSRGIILERPDFSHICDTKCLYDLYMYYSREPPYGDKTKQKHIKNILCTKENLSEECPECVQICEEYGY